MNINTIGSNGSCFVLHSFHNERKAFQSDEKDNWIWIDSKEPHEPWKKPRLQCCRWESLLREGQKKQIVQVSRRTKRVEI